jgi:putative ABC transport system substrate-binding protein
VRVWRIGYLGPAAETAPKLLKAFQDGLAERGYREGGSTVIEYRWTNAGTAMNDEATLVASARDLVARKVDVIAASIDLAILAASKATKTVPIVMLNATDPVGSGFVESLSHPGGNITGMTNQSADLLGKRLQTLREIVPGAARVGMLVSGPARIKEQTTAAARNDAAKLGLTLDVIEVPTPAALDDAFSALKRAGSQALFIADTGGGIFFTERKRLADLALANRLPSMVANAEVVEAGALISVAPNSVDNYLRAATFIEKILKGVKPADIPVEQPTAFDTTINLKTARALNVVIPPALRVAARYVGE